MVTIPDDQSLVIHVDKAILIVFGCAHAGIINVIHHAIRMTGVDTIYGIKGQGGHLQLVRGNVILKEAPPPSWDMAWMVPP